MRLAPFGESQILNYIIQGNIYREMQRYAGFATMRERCQPDFFHNLLQMLSPPQPQAQVIKD